MSKRLQVILPDDEYNKIKRNARHAKQNLASWVRNALRRISDSEPNSSEEEKLRILKKALTISAPIDDISVIKEQIQQGYLK
jgi:hypothetical protein